MNQRPTPETGVGRYSCLYELMRPPGKVTHAPYRREPYIRVQLGDGVTVDAKAAAWTRTHVLAHWIDGDGKAHDKWVPAERVRRIPRSDSAWQDPYDIDHTD